MPPDEIPPPTSDQLCPSQRASPWTGTLPDEFAATVMLPPTYRAGPRPSSNSHMARGVPSTPIPSGSQVTPFHIATPVAETPPIELKIPAANSRLPWPRLAPARTPTEPSELTCPSTFHELPAHWTTPFP